jgi:hypothetical protein
MQDVVQTIGLKKFGEICGKSRKVARNGELRPGDRFGAVDKFFNNSRNVPHTVVHKIA